MLIINGVSSLENRIVILLIEDVATYCVDDIPGHVTQCDNGIKQSAARLLSFESVLKLQT